MTVALADWLKARWPAWAAGVLAWVLLAAGAALYAGANGLDAWKLALAWDEWVVAIGALVRVVLPVWRKTEVVNPRARRVLGWAGEITWVLLVIFLLDLLTRAVLGLGLDPF